MAWTHEGPPKSPGHPHGTPNKQAEQLRRIREDVVQSWLTEPTGLRILEDLKANDPAAYIRFIVAILPKEPPEQPAPLDVRIVIGPDRCKPLEAVEARNAAMRRELVNGQP